MKLLGKNLYSNPWTAISELVAICETQGFIPRFYTDGP